MLTTVPGAVSVVASVNTIVAWPPPVVDPERGTMYSTTCSVFAQVLLVVKTPYAFPSSVTVIIAGAESVTLPQTELVVLVKVKPVSRGAAANESKLY